MLRLIMGCLGAIYGMYGYQVLCLVKTVWRMDSPSRPPPLTLQWLMWLLWPWYLAAFRDRSRRSVLFYRWRWWYPPFVSWW